MSANRLPRSTRPQGWMAVAVTVCHLGLGWGLMHAIQPAQAPAAANGPVAMLTLLPLAGSVGQGARAEPQARSAGGRRAGAAAATSSVTPSTTPSALPSARRSVAPSAAVPSTAAGLDMTADRLGAAVAAAGPHQPFQEATPAPTSTGRVASAPAVTVARLTQPPRPLSGNVLPRYPEAAREDALEGTVRLRVEVAPDGHVQAVQWAVRSGVMLLDVAARDAVRQWHFQPALHEGEPVAGSLTVTLQFRLQGDPVLLAMAGLGLP
jgi:protein TonB